MKDRKIVEGVPLIEQLSGQDIARMIVAHGASDSAQLLQVADIREQEDALKNEKTKKWFFALLGISIHQMYTNHARPIIQRLTERRPAINLSGPITQELITKGSRDIDTIDKICVRGIKQLDQVTRKQTSKDWFGDVYDQLVKETDWRDTTPVNKLSDGLLTETFWEKEMFRMAAERYKNAERATAGDLFDYMELGLPSFVNPTSGMHMTVLGALGKEINEYVPDSGTGLEPLKFQDDKFQQTPSGPKLDHEVLKNVVRAHPNLVGAHLGCPGRLDARIVTARTNQTSDFPHAIASLYNDTITFIKGGKQL